LLYLFKEKINTKSKTYVIQIALLLSSLLILASLFLDIGIIHGSEGYSQNNNTNKKFKLINPNADLVDRFDNLINDISFLYNKKNNSGTIADGVSKILIVVESNQTLKFSIDDTRPENITNGTIGSLGQPNYSNSLSSFAIVQPKSIDNGKSLAVAVYTPPNYIILPKDTDYRTIHILLNDTINFSSIPIELYRVPIVLVHGIWTDSTLSWKFTHFKKALEDNNFNVSLADYGKYNATTFDPIAISEKGNYGIDSIRNATKEILQKYEDKGIAASQVDIVAHSMGGLMARGLSQQSDYKNENNYMKGYIHRLITIGTPHFGAELAGILYDHRDKYYCHFWNSSNFKLFVTPHNNCSGDQTPLKLRDIYKNLSIPIDEGGIEALKPESDAYSHLYKTNISSYAIIGNWKPNAQNSHQYLERFYQNITDNPDFKLEGKEVFGEDNDLQVSITSQSGGLLDYSTCNPENAIAHNGSKIYNNTVHGSPFIYNDTNVDAELDSKQIQYDVILLLNSSNNQFAPSIGDIYSCPTIK
jgi:pimeloyl-ACP methyl ester carboxylesterase